MMKTPNLCSILSRYLIPSPLLYYAKSYSFFFTLTMFLCLEPATQYSLSVLGFTPKREGVMTDTIQVTTDTNKPSPPIITNVNCTGKTQNKNEVCSFL